MTPGDLLARLCEGQAQHQDQHQAKFVAHQQGPTWLHQHLAERAAADHRVRGSQSSAAPGTDAAAGPRQHRVTANGSAVSSRPFAGMPGSEGTGSLDYDIYDRCAAAIADALSGGGRLMADNDQVSTAIV